MSLPYKKSNDISSQFSTFSLEISYYNSIFEISDQNGSYPAKSTPKVPTLLNHTISFSISFGRSWGLTRVLGVRAARGPDVWNSFRAFVAMSLSSYLAAATAVPLTWHACRTHSRLRVATLPCALAKSTCKEK